MSITLLLDLDDTLLTTNVDAFVPAYFEAISAALADVIAPDTMVAALMGGTRLMMENTDPAVTLQEVFDSYFFAKLGKERAHLINRFDQFYDDIFPKLRRITQQRPDAIRFVNWGMRAGHQIAVATNPYFPLKAVKHRLRWAGLSPDEYPFALISSYEQFHFSKEHSAFFREFLGQMGWLNGPAVMVGNDLAMDLLPARAAGLPVFWVRDAMDGIHPEIPQGSFIDLQNWLESIDEAELIPRTATHHSILATLRATPAALSSLTTQLPAETWTAPPSEGEWCLTEILCHMRDVEAEINQQRLVTILEENNPFLAGVDSDPWSSERQYINQSGKQALNKFIEHRKGILDLLEKNENAWGRVARHSFFGPTTLLELFGIVAGHDQAHIHQAWTTIGAWNSSQKANQSSTVK